MQIVDYFLEMFALASAKETQGIFFFVAVYATTVLLYSLAYQIRLKSWPSTLAKLTDERVTEFGHNDSRHEKMYKASLSYHYVVDGSDFVGTRLSPWLFITNNNASFILKNQLKSVLRDDSGSVAAYYNPKKPHKSFLVKPGLLGILITGTLSVIPMALYFSKYYG